MLSPTRWKLRKAIKITNQVLDQLKVEKHPDKTFIGKVDREFDFLGYHFTPQAENGLQVANKTIENHVTNITRLYEQDASIDRIGDYIRNWWRWVKGGVALKFSPALYPLHIYIYLSFSLSLRLSSSTTPP